MKYIASVYTIKSKLPFGDKSRAKIVVEEASSTYVQKIQLPGFRIRENARWMLCSARYFGNCDRKERMNKDDCENGKWDRGETRMDYRDIPRLLNILESQIPTMNIDEGGATISFDYLIQFKVDR